MTRMLGYLMTFAAAAAGASRLHHEVQALADQYVRGIAVAVAQVRSGAAPVEPGCEHQLAAAAADAHEAVRACLGLRHEREVPHAP
ncbi:hypothetical protein [Vulcaniibacterium gelatinicum]|uniref:hypothetical protein n=1 Tax=Vulcaniibacterium gelatinicum TaxID=2598725 RepID=UPI0011C6F41C|nr:hypothetical protein [Vulcaniibacterium gelatinicum]